MTMTATIHALPMREKGNGSREALSTSLLNAGVTNEALAPFLTDYVLGNLYLDGFVIVPIGGQKDAR